MLFGVCVSVQSCETTHVSCGCGEHRPLQGFGVLSEGAGPQGRAVGLPRWSSRAPISDLESYPYRIGTVHMCRDAAYADAGVRSGAFSWDSSLVNFPGVALDV